MSPTQVLRCIASREARLEEVKQVLQAFWWHRGRDTDALGSVDALAGLRYASVDVVLAILVSICMRTTLKEDKTQKIFADTSSRIVSREQMS